MSLKYIHSRNLDKWTDPAGPGWGTDEGAQLQVYRGQLLGVYNANSKGYENQVWGFNMEDTKMSNAYIANGSFRATSRISVTVLNDIYYQVHLGGGHVWISSTTLPTKGFSWSAAKALKDGKTKDFAIAPTICAFDGNLFVYAVTADYQIFYTQLDSTGKQIIQWTRQSSWATTRPVGLAVYQNKLYMTHVGGPAFYTTSVSSRTGTWTDLVKTDYATPASGPTLVAHSDDKLYIVFQGNGERIVKGVLYEDKKFGGWVAVGSSKISGQPGAASHDGRLYIAFAQKNTNSTGETSYESDDEVFEQKQQMQSQWDSSYDIDETPAPKRWYRRLLCSS